MARFLSFYGQKIDSKIFWKYFRVRTEKLHRIKVNKSQKKFGKYFYWRKNSFFGAKSLSVNTDICFLICGCVMTFFVVFRPSRMTSKSRWLCSTQWPIQSKIIMKFQSYFHFEYNCVKVKSLEIDISMFDIVFFFIPKFIIFDISNTFAWIINMG